MYFHRIYRNKCYLFWLALTPSQPSWIRTLEAKSSVLTPVPSSKRNKLTDTFCQMVEVVSNVARKKNEIIIVRMSDLPNTNIHTKGTLSFEIRTLGPRIHL